MDDCALPLPSLRGVRGEPQYMVTLSLKMSIIDTLWNYEWLNVLCYQIFQYRAMVNGSSEIVWI